MEENRISGLRDLGIPDGAWNVFYVAGNGRILGAVLIADPIRKDLRRAINRLRREGIDEILMFTGDSKQNTEAVTRMLDLDGYQSNMLPQDKADFIARKQPGARVLMVGDGIFRAISGPLLSAFILLRTCLAFAVFPFIKLFRPRWQQNMRRSANSQCLSPVAGNEIAETIRKHTDATEGRLYFQVLDIPES